MRDRADIAAAIAAFSDSVMRLCALYLHERADREDIMQEMYTMLRLATKARLRYMNKSTLADLDTSKAVLDVFIQQANKVIFTDRNGRERRLLTDQSFGVWSAKVAEIGALIGGWMASVAGRKSSDNKQ